MKRVLVVDDSSFGGESLHRLLVGDVSLDVIGTARDGAEAVEKVPLLRPDVVVMDVGVPGTDGFATTQEIMATNAVPIVLVGTPDGADMVETTFRAIDAGAVAALPRPVESGHPGHDRQVEHLRQTVRAMSEVKVITRYRGTGPLSPDSLGPEPTKPGASRRPSVEVVSIGASTGGPLSLRTILSTLPADFPVPILVVQHIAQGFLPGMVEWLAQTTPLRLRIAIHGQTAQPGHVYFGPNGFFLGIDRRRTLTLKPCAPGTRLCPSVAHLFEATCSAFNHRSVGVLLTGMGRDGAAELQLLRTAGAVTIAQDVSTSVVHGMPGEAIAMGAASYVLPDTDIAARLIRIVAPSQTRGGAAL